MLYFLRFRKESSKLILKEWSAGGRHSYLQRRRSWKGPILGSSSSSHVRDQASHPGTWWETWPPVPLEPCLQTLILAVESKMALGLGSRPTQPWPRAILAHTGAPPVTRLQPSQGLGGSHTHHPPGNRPTDWSSSCGSWSRLMFQCHPTEQGPGGSLVHPGTRQNPHPPKPLVTSKLRITLQIQQQLHNWL